MNPWEMRAREWEPRHSALSLDGRRPGPSGEGTRTLSLPLPGPGQTPAGGPTRHPPLPPRGALSRMLPGPPPQLPPASSGLPGTLTHGGQPRQDAAGGRPASFSQARCRHDLGDGRGYDGFHGTQSNKPSEEPNLQEAVSGTGTLELGFPHRLYSGRVRGG